MGYEKCLLTFNDATGLTLSDEERKTMILNMLKTREKIMRDRAKAPAGTMPLFNSDDAFKMAADKLGADKEEAAKNIKIGKLKDAILRNNELNKVVNAGGIRQAAEYLRSLLHGSNKLGRESIESAWTSKRGAIATALVNQLDKLGVYKAITKGTMDRDIERAMFKISNGEAPDKGIAGKVAKIYSTLLDHIRDQLNAAGADIGDSKNYITKTMHNVDQMLQAAGSGKTIQEAFDAWWAKTLPRLSDVTFKDIAPNKKTEFGRMVFNSIVTGVDKIGGSESGNGFIHPDFQNTLNVANKVSQSKTLIFKDADAWHDHMQDFGNFTTLHANVLNAIDQGYRSLALMDRLGRNPMANYNMLIDKISQTYRDLDPQGVIDFQKDIPQLKHAMGYLDGSLNRPANMGMAKLTNNLMTAEVVSDLGSVGFTHLASVWPTVTSELAQHGINRFEAMGNLMKSIVTGMGDSERRDIFSDLGAYDDHALKHMRDSLNNDSVPGKLSSFAGHFMDATGLPILYDRVKAGIKGMLAHNLARNLDKEFSTLDPHLQNMLGKYGITAADWASMKGAELRAYGGRSYLTPSSVEHISQDLSDKLLSYYSDAANHGVVTPGIQAKTALLRGTRPGTVEGSALRLFAQFKMWPVAAMTQVLEKEIYMSLSKSEAAWNIGKLIAIGVPAGYMRMAVSDMVNGRPLKDPRDPATLLAAAGQSGGLGIMGDYLFGETSRMGADPLSTIAGPVAADVGSLFKIYKDFMADNNTLMSGHGTQHKNGAYGDVWPQLARFAVHHIPMANLVYLKGALDYLLWYHLYEAASPGWWERSNRAMQKKQGRTMTGYIPGAGVPTGVPGIYLNAGGNTTGLLSGK